MTAPAQYKWFFETTTPVEGHMHAIARTITTRQTKFQFMEIMETLSYGKCLVLDGRIQSSQADEFIYHELLVQPGLLAHPRPERAMVIGGGEGATVREILRHRSITDCLMVDIDGEVVDECKKHLPEMHQGAFDDPRTRLLHEDARAYLEKTSERFDLIVVDLVEPLEEGPACLLFTKEFYTLVRDRLTDRGVMTMQAGMTKVNEVFFYGAVNRTLREVFPVVAPYRASSPASARPGGSSSRRRARTRAGSRPPTSTGSSRSAWTRHPSGTGTGQAHLHSFNLPKFLRRAIETNDRVITDCEPLIVT